MGGGVRRTPFRSLAVRNFRLFAAGQVVSVAGTWMMVTAQDWLVLSLTGDSGTALGTVTALQFTPLLLFTLYGGRLADRHDKHVGGLASAAAALAVLLAGRTRRFLPSHRPEPALLGPGPFPERQPHESPE